MKIELLDHVEGDVVAREINIDSFVGHFTREPDGRVVYRPPDGGSAVSANSSVEVFTACATVWNEYSCGVLGQSSEEKELEDVARMKRRIEEIELGDEESFWPAVIQQAEHGML